MPRLRVLAAAAIASAALLGWTQTAQATTTTAGTASVTAGSVAATVKTPIGTISATQYMNFCDDFGAQVRVTIAGGDKSTRYTVWGTGFSQTATTVTTNAAGAATIDLHNIGVPTGGAIGAATILVSTGFYTAAVQPEIACSYGEGG